MMYPLVYLPTVLVDLIIFSGISLSVGNGSHLPSLVVSTVGVMSPTVLVVTDFVIAAEETFWVVPVVSNDAVVEATKQTPDIKSRLT